MHEKIVIVANSRKLNGRCVAGKTLDNRWVRMVKPNGESVPDLEAQELEVLGVYNVEGIEFEKDFEVPYHTENHTYTTFSKIGYINQVDELMKLIDRPDVIFGSLRRCIPKCQADLLDNSLLFIRVKNVVIKKVQTEYGVKKRCDFEYNGDCYVDFSLTHPYYEELLDNKPVGYSQSYEDCFLTVSLGVPFNGYAYKLVASIIPIES